ncbi:hypothetical protein LTR84_002594 [Exophiala bonariae]|uniref:mRNA export factor MEX67 n=1 Tax=Exophiala bonariae TaxID=1690606 RepID=A0AAV9NB83_9EURO|nr:hypothetical protein LTR84_002594 [Exophiala bonariae]
MSFGTRQNGNDSSSTTQIAIKGWLKSGLANSKDQGVEALVGFLSKKASRPILSHTRAGAAVLLITVNAQDQDRFFHLNGFTFSGASLIVEAARPPRSQFNPAHSNNHQNYSQNNSRGPPHSNGNQTHPQNTFRGQAHGQPVPRGPRGPFQDNNSRNNPSSHRAADPTTTELENLIIEVIRERYHAGDKHLILNALVSDPKVTTSGLSSQDPIKVWKAIFTICEKHMWETASKRREAVESISLRDDNITSVKDILSLSNIFPTIKNLDLSNNHLADLDALKFWKNQFRDLEHIILIGNPVSNNPDTLQTLLSWYPRLKLYNNEPVRDAAGNINIPQPQPNLPNNALGGLQPNPSAPTASHPEFPPGSTFGLPEPNKSAEVLQKEQMGLQFSFETKLKMEWVENCLSANNWVYDAAIANFMELRAQNQIPPEAYITGV